MNFLKKLLPGLIGLFALMTCLNVSAIETSAIDIAKRYENPTTYTITRKGKRIGTHELRFDTANNQLVVSVSSKIRVTILKVPVFLFDYQSTEIWNDGKLTSASSKVRENNKNTSVSMLSGENSTQLNKLKGRQTVDRLFYTSNHWNSKVLNQTRVFNTLSGKASNVSIALVEDNVKMNGIDCRRYRYYGDIKADVWYDTSGRWVKLQFKGDDGSTIEYTIDQ